VRTYGEAIDVRTHGVGSSGVGSRGLRPAEARGRRPADQAIDGRDIDGRDADGRDVDGWGADGGDVDVPVQFLWRGRLYLVRDVLAHWVELGTWWSVRGARSSRGPAAPSSTYAEEGRRSVAADVGAVEREVWRVEAAAGRSGTGGVYDLVRDVPDPTTGAPVVAARWRLARALD
jgi:hypothetical protein